MARGSVPVDLFNPGQVFACFGLMEVAEVIIGRTEGEFDWSDSGASQFHLRTAGDEDPISVALHFLNEASVRILVPHGKDIDIEKWKLEAHPRVGEDVGLFPQPAADKPASLPAVLATTQHEITIQSWGDATNRDNVKFWAGSGGLPGASLVRDALELVRGKGEELRIDPFNFAAPQSSSLRFDWRRDYVPMGVGFSLNKHSHIQPRGYPLVEVLAVIGLNNARPDRPSRSDKLNYRYAVAGGRAFPASLHRAALGCADLPFPMRRFRISLDWPGKENQARCITSVKEETRS